MFPVDEDAWRFPACRDGTICDTEYGPLGGDELNHIMPSRNYGWPVITYGMDYDGTPMVAITVKEGME